MRTSIGVDPVAKGEPETVVAAPVDKLMENAETVELPALATYKKRFSGSTATDRGLLPAVADTDPADTREPERESMPKIATVSALLLATKRSLETFPLVVLVGADPPPSPHATRAIVTKTTSSELRNWRHQDSIASFTLFGRSTYPSATGPIALQGVWRLASQEHPMLVAATHRLHLSTITGATRGNSSFPPVNDNRALYHRLGVLTVPFAKVHVHSTHRGRFHDAAAPLR
jgi:hypothetical protein